MVTSVSFLSLFSVEIKGKKLHLFLDFDAKATVDGNPTPGFVFASNPSMAVLFVLKCGKKRYAIVVKQPRVATGEAASIEIPAGIFDHEGNFKSNMAREINEELGININEAELLDLSELAGHTRGFFPSPGRCSEAIRLFYVEQEVDEAFMKALKGRRTGAKEELEFIKVDVIPLDDLLKLTDGKAHVALGLYKKFVLGARRSRKATEAD
jgi:8-oxo-dGTP pyrophosphatase MutT (NUDIX family)